MIIQKLKKIKNNSLKVLRVTYNEFENALERNLGKRHQIW